MRPGGILIVVFGLFAGGVALWAFSAPLEPIGIAQRIPWTSSRVHGSPEPPPPYRTEPAFPKLVFQSPIELVRIPGTDRLAVAESGGSIYSFPNHSAAEHPSLLLQLQPHVLGLAFHPRFAENGYCFVTRSDSAAQEVRVSRFQADRENFRCSAASEQVLLSWPGSPQPGGPHQGGALRFGPDGLLYIAIGDGSESGDERETGQDLRDFLSAILRIDVDGAENGKAYRVPRDNPFVGRAGARPEIYAYGLRHPWKMSFDRATGELWAGEVGQDLWESVVRIERGGNYGWSILEGGHPFRPDRQRGPTPILPPVVQHPHSEFRSLIGGYVYRGSRLPELAGVYIYGDHETGRIWGLRHDGANLTWQGELARTHQRTVAFGEDSAGELFMLDHFLGTVSRLVANPASAPAAAFPRRLSETGLFASTKDHLPAPGVIPYSVNAPLWSDHAHKERFMALPGAARIGFEALANRVEVRAIPGWSFPDGTVLVKTFSLDLEHGKPATRRRLETRLLHLEKLADTDSIRDQYWRGYTYIWNDEQTDAELADAAGVDRSFTIQDPDAPGGARQQTWHFPSRAECTLCHSMPAGFVLGVNTWQMNKDHDYHGVQANQLATLGHLEIFREPLPARPARLGKLVNYADAREDINDRARSYLHANCAHCHTLYGGGNAPFQLQANLRLADTGVMDTPPLHGKFDLPDPRLVLSGAPERSVLHQRMTRLGPGRMPPVASLVVDQAGTQLIHDWIRQGPSEKLGPLGQGIRNGLIILAVWGVYRGAYWLRRRRASAMAR